MLKISELNVGQQVSITLLVKEAAILFTKPPKNSPYLSGTFTDGKDDIKVINWDWLFATAPDKGSVADIEATVGEYLGTKQLTARSVKRNTTVPVASFAPDGGVDLMEYQFLAGELIRGIGNAHIQGIVAQAFKDHASQWDVLPAAKGIHHAFVSGLLKHSVDVALKAQAIAQLVPTADLDLTVGGALIHDIGKIWTYTLKDAIIDMTDEGNLFEHIMLGVLKVEQYRTPANSGVLDLLQHIITSHHGKIEYGSPMTPKFIEAHIISAADGIDATTQTILEVNEKSKPEDDYTDKVWTLGNRQQYTQSRVQRILQANEPCLSCGENAVTGTNSICNTCFPSDM